jgi:hypothetical protein
MVEDDNVEIGLVPTRQTQLVITKDTDDDDDIWTYRSLFSLLYFRFAFFILIPLSHNS